MHFRKTLETIRQQKLLLFPTESGSGSLRLCGIVLLAGFAFGCDSGPSEEAAVRQAGAAKGRDAPVVAELEFPGSQTDESVVRDMATRLAGLHRTEEPSGDPVSPGTAKLWTGHAEQMEALWSELESRHLSKMRGWAEDELPLLDAQAPLFYPFGGPDLPSVLQFFPAAKTVVLVGLEPVGRIPEPAGLDDEVLSAELTRLRTGLANLVESGYFLTKGMERDFAASHLEGTLPVLLMLLPRVGWDPLAVHLVQLDAAGEVQPLDVATPSTATAVRIDCEVKGEARSLFYVSQDLSDEGLAVAPGFVAFLEHLGAANVFMKSASYLLHMEGFTALKALLLKYAGTILQDDSGIPFRDLVAAPGWNHTLFGAYTDTLPTYRDWAQDDLRAAYVEAETDALPFAIAYNSRIGGTCLIWAQRPQAL